MLLFILLLLISACSKKEITADSFLRLTEAQLIQRCGQPIMVTTNNSPDGPFKIIQFDKTKGSETFFVIFADEGWVRSGHYKGVSVDAP